MPNIANPFAAAADHRRSIRKYTEESIPEDQLRELLRLAGRAPSPWNLQPWRWVVVREPNLKARLQEASYNQPQVGRAPAVLVLYSDFPDALRRANNPKFEASFAGMDHDARAAWGLKISYIALGYLLLVAEGHGIATSPMLGFDPPQVRRLLGLPDDAPIAAVVALGQAAEEGVPSNREPVDGLTAWR